jgi:hypothetical protein
MTIKRGDICSNGAVVLDYRQSWNEQYVVLCLWTTDIQQEEIIYRNADPYVTWIAERSPEGGIITRNGHYFDRLSQAVVDFDSRV